MAYLQDVLAPRFNIEDLPAMYSAWRLRYRDRDLRMNLMDDVVRGDYHQVDPSEDPLTSRSPNLIQVALEDTAEAASLMPTIRVKPYRLTKGEKQRAARQERVAAGYFSASNMAFQITQTVMDLAGFGFGCWVVWPDTDQRLPLIEKRDPRHCYPEPGYRPGDTVQRCLFAREIYLTQLPAAHQAAVKAAITPDNGGNWGADTKVVLCEFWDTERIVVAALYQRGSLINDVSFHPVLLEEHLHELEVCPVVLGSRFALDGEFRGQFDQVTGVLLAHVRLMAMVLDYADQSVYSDIWVKDLIGEMPYGGGAYIELGPQGAIGRIPPAVTSLNIQQDLQNLVDALHVGGRWPKSRPGEIDQAIASAKFLEATAGMMNTAIKTYHQILKNMMERALRIAFMCDRQWFPGKKTIDGTLRNQEFIEEYDSSNDIELRNTIRVEYGLGLGRDPAQSAVLMIQYSQNEYISKQFVQENLEGVTDVAREQARTDVEKLRSMALAQLLQGLEQGTIPHEALVKIAQDRENGDDIFDLYQRYVIDPAKQQAEGQMQSGLGGPVTPGPVPPGMPAVTPPGAPPGPAGAPTGPAGVMPPPPPEASQLIARLGVPAGNRQSFLGSQVGG